MSTDRDVTRDLRSWLREDAHEDADRVLGLVLDQLDTTPQRRASWPARRFPIMNSNVARVALVAAVLVVAVIVGASLLRRPSVGPSPTVEATATAGAVPPLLNTLPTGDLAAGNYRLDEVFPVKITLTLPAGYTHGRGASDNVGIQSAASGPQHGIEFQLASNVYPDPCHSASGPANPPIGANLSDLVTAMTSMIGFQAGPVTDVTIGGYAAKAFDLANGIDAAACDGQDIRAFVFTGGGSSSVSSGQRERIYLMYAPGHRLMIMTYYLPNGDTAAEAAAAAELKAIVESISIGRN
jgi:hypothetical protein